MRLYCGAFVASSALLLPLIVHWSEEEGMSRDVREEDEGGLRMERETRGDAALDIIDAVDNWLLVRRTWKITYCK